MGTVFWLQATAGQATQPACVTMEPSQKTVVAGKTREVGLSIRVADGSVPVVRATRGKVRLLGKTGSGTYQFVLEPGLSSVPKVILVSAHTHKLASSFFEFEPWVGFRSRGRGSSRKPTNWWGSGKW